MQPGYGQPGTGERWNVNMPAVIGVVFVFLIAVVVWVIASAVGDDGDPDRIATAPDPTPVSTTTPSTSAAVSTSVAPPIGSVSGTTTPAPMPATTVPADGGSASTTPTPTTSPPATAAPATEPPATTVPGTAAPATTAPGADPGTVPGDLGVPARPMQRPPCDDAYITVLASSIGDQATSESLAVVLDQYPGSNYLRTDEACSSLTQASEGEPIYVVYFGPFAAETDACTARADGPDGAYARRLSNDLTPDHFVEC